MAYGERIDTGDSETADGEPIDADPAAADLPAFLTTDEPAGAALNSLPRT